LPDVFAELRRLHANFELRERVRPVLRALINSPQKVKHHNGRAVVQNRRNFLQSVCALAQTAPPALPFHRLDGCVYKPQRWDDGDSFHVILSDEKELISRLYFVDAPESACAF
jgi:endonuclease YncB( thermonuclease family)